MGIPLTLAWAAQQPWAIRPETLALLKAILVRRHVHGRMTDDEVRAALAGGEPQRQRIAAERFFDPEADEFFHAVSDEYWRFIGYRGETSGRVVQSKRRGVVEVLGVYGIISQRASQVDDISGPGGTSIERLTQRFRAARDDDGVSAIVFDHDSPGGGVYGVQELADEIRAARGIKPIAAVANSLAASASYWLYAQADPGEATVTPSGEVGSVGVYAAHEDLSKMLEQEGVKVTLVSAGEFKTEGNPFESLGEEARSTIQGRVDDYYSAFVEAVSKGRDVAIDSVRDGFGRGRVVGAKQAVAEGIADRIATLDETARRLARQRPPQPAAQATEPAWAQAERDAAVARQRVL